MYEFSGVLLGVKRRNLLYRYTARTTVNSRPELFALEKESGEEFFIS
jgi:hypothetical protein